MSTSTFFGLELSRRALASQQLALDITGHNIANANTQGYTRQVANMTPTSPYSIPALGRNLSLGTGVTLDYISRARDSFVDRQYRWETAKQQYWEGRQNALQKVERIYNEPSESSLHSDMDKFWTAWSDLSKNPENMGARAVVRERALTLIDTFHHIAQQISDLKEDLDANVRVQINQINSYAKQIGDLNDLIKKAEVAGDSPNDLRDQRDSLIDELSKITSVRVVETKDTSFTDRVVNDYKVYIVDETASNLLVYNSTPRFLEEDPSLIEDSNGFARVLWADDLTTDVIDLSQNRNMGKLEANLRIREEYLVQLEEEFDTLAQGLVYSVNRVHQEGLGLPLDPSDPATRQSVDFFEVTDTNADGVVDINDITAQNISLNSEINSDTRNIAAGDKNSGVGDGSIAAKIASLSGGWDPLTELGEDRPINSTSIGDYYGANVAKMGVDVQQANRMKDGQDVLVNHLLNQRESLSGVSLDEEMTNLMKFQKSYSAAARLVTMMDDMLDTLINRTGVTR